MGDATDEFRILPHAEKAEESVPEEHADSETDWSEDFDVGFDQESTAARPSALRRVRTFFGRLFGRMPDDPGLFVVDDPDEDARETPNGLSPAAEIRDRAPGRPAVIEAKVVDLRREPVADRLAGDPMAPSKADETPGPLRSVAHSASADSADEFSRDSAAESPPLDAFYFEKDELQIAEKAQEPGASGWGDHSGGAPSLFRRIVSFFVRPKEKPAEGDELLVASGNSMRTRFRGAEVLGDPPPPDQVGIAQSPGSPEPLAVDPADEFSIGSNSAARKFARSNLNEIADRTPDTPNPEADDLVVAGGKRETARFRPEPGAAGLSAGDGATEAADSLDGEGLTPDEQGLSEPIGIASAISGQLEGFLDASKPSAAALREGEPIAIGMPLDQESPAAPVRSVRGWKLAFRLLLWAITIPRRCLAATGDLADQARPKIEPILAAIPACLAVMVLISAISGTSTIDKYASSLTYLERSRAAEKSGDSAAASLAAIRACSDNPTSDARYRNASLLAISRDPVGEILGYRLLRNLASPAGNHQPDAHLFIAQEILKRIGNDPVRFRRYFHQYLSELRAGLESAPNRFDILELLAEGLLQIGEDTSLTAILTPNLEFWTQGHYYLAQAAFARGDEELRKTHAMAMVRHFRSTPAELELDRKFRIRFAISLAMAGEFDEAETFVAGKEMLADTEETRKFLAERVRLIRTLDRIQDLPSGSDEDVQLLGAQLELDDLSPFFSAAVKRELLRKGPNRPALLELCRRLHQSRNDRYSADDFVYWASILRQNQQNDEARDYLESALKLAPDHLIAANNLANLLYKLEPYDLDRALTLINIVIETNKNQPVYLETRGQILARLERHDEAILDLTKALESFPNVPEIHETLADCYRKTGNAMLADAHRARFDELKNREQSQANTASGSNDS